MPLTPPQQTIADSPHRFRVVAAGRRFGKSYLAIRELARFSRQPDRLSWYVAPTRGQAKGIIWEQLKSRLMALRWVKKINESELRIDLVNHSAIELRSADAYDRMRGFSVSGLVVFDEFADMAPDVWTVVRPALADRGGHALFIGTPKGNQNWARDLYDMSLQHPEDWCSFSYTTIDGLQVTAEEVEAARQQMDTRLFRQEFLATFEDAGNQVFYAWDRAHNIQHQPDLKPTQLWIGMDFNYSPMTAVIGQVQGQHLHIRDEIRLTTSNTDEMTAEILRRYPDIPRERIQVYPDPACRQNKTSAGGRTDLSILQNAGFTVHCPRSHDPVRDGINAVNSRLATAAGDHYLTVDPSCRYTIESLERLSYQPGTTQPIKGEYDHMADSLRYLVGYLWPIRQQQPRLNPGRWSHLSV